MKYRKFDIEGIPALLVGEASEQVWLYLHGKLGRKEEGLTFGRQAVPAGFQVLAIDLPEHGARCDGKELLPWVVVPELHTVEAYMKQRWKRAYLRANSIGAWFGMEAFDESFLSRALFVSPVADMASLIRHMMRTANVTAQDLERDARIPTDGGEVLRYDYYRWATEHPVQWSVPTEILYGSGDFLIPETEIRAFSAAHGCALTVMEGGEHWFHTPEQVDVLHRWEREHI